MFRLSKAVGDDPMAGNLWLLNRRESPFTSVPCPWTGGTGTLKDPQ
jgi:hypothetical protein